jgi:hypothetical protein
MRRVGSGASTEFQHNYGLREIFVRSLMKVLLALAALLVLFATLLASRGYWALNTERPSAWNISNPIFGSELDPPNALLSIAVKLSIVPALLLTVHRFSRPSASPRTCTREQCVDHDACIAATNEKFKRIALILPWFCLPLIVALAGGVLINIARWNAT